MQNQRPHPIVMPDEVMQQISVIAGGKLYHFIAGPREEKQRSVLQGCNVIVLLKLLHLFDILFEL